MNTESVKDSYYVCPLCKQPLTPTIDGLFCQRDGVEYSVKNGIVDFIVEDITKSTSPVLRSVDKIDEFAKIYEGPSWYGIMDKINAELNLPSIEDMVKMMTERVDAENGVGLDVACGTGFVTRHLAQKMRLVYGIDISMGMLEEATKYAREKEIENIRFARSMVENLPFPNGVFDGVTCSGALHLFQDTVEALNEMARVMKRGARLAVLANAKGDLSVFKRLFERSGTSIPFGEEESLEMLHLFDAEELDSYLSQTGFKGFAYTIYGPFILFHAEKG
ncbi:MAG: methyltransferase domain-containing protein [Halobacteriota archaeon]